jgi:hypothetical protein
MVFSKGGKALAFACCLHFPEVKVALLQTRLSRLRIQQVKEFAHGLSMV